MRLITLAILAVTLSACSDWHLRGTRTDIVGIESAAINAAAAPLLRNALVQELSYSGVSVRQRKDAEAILELTREEFDRRVLSVDPDTGKVREIELGLKVGLTIRDRAGKLLAPLANLSWTRDFVFDETALLGNYEQETVTRRELALDAAKTIVLRLETIEPPPDDPQPNNVTSK